MFFGTKPRRSPEKTCKIGSCSIPRKAAPNQGFTERRSVQQKRSGRYLLCPTPEQKRSICPTEPERIRKRIFHIRFPGLIRYVVQIAAFVRRFEIDSRRQNAVAQCHDGDPSLQPARATQ